MKFDYLSLKRSHLTPELGVVVQETIIPLLHGCYAKHVLHTTKGKMSKFKDQKLNRTLQGTKKFKNQLRRKYLIGSTDEKLEHKVAFLMHLEEFITINWENGPLSKFVSDLTVL